MQLKLSFSVLLASIIATSWSPAATFVEAAPARRNAGMVSLPLKRVQARGNFHPQIMYQQHVNRGHRRLARMTGCEGPTRREMEDKLVKRIISAGETELVKRYSTRETSQFQKRYNRQGTSRPQKGQEVPGLNQLKSLKGLDGLKNLKGVIPDDLIGQLTGDQGLSAGGNTAGSTASGSTNNTGGNATAEIGGEDAVTAVQNGDLLLANGPTASNSLGLNVEANDVGYMATVQIGTPPTSFMILMDSGSADFWVGSDNCQLIVQQNGGGGGGGAQGNNNVQGGGNGQGGGCGNHQFLSAQSSSSFQDTQQPFQVTYGSGAVAGNVVQDNVVLAGLALNGHTFGTASQETQDFADDSVPFDGLMGLAQSTLSEQKTLTPVEAAAKANLIPDAITSYKISRASDNKNDGQVTFGGLDQTKFDPQTLQTVDNVSKKGFWEGDMPAVTVDGQDVGLQGRTAILDTGTTLIIAPPNDALAVHQAIPGAGSDGQGGFTIPCGSNTSVALTFGQQAFAIDPRDLAFAPVDPSNPNGDCLSGISAGQIGGPQEWLVGDVFLKNAYFSTDVAKNQLSLAKLV